MERRRIDENAKTTPPWRLFQYVLSSTPAGFEIGPRVTHKTGGQQRV